MSSAITQGSTPANEVSLQIRSGVVTMTTAAPVKVITFSNPMIALNYTVVIEPFGGNQPITVSAKTINGFTLTLHANATIRWAAIYSI